MIKGYHCAVCGEYHDELPLAFGAAAPFAYAALSEEERARRAALSSDQYVIDDEWFFVRGQLELPMIGTDEVFTWGVWVSLSEASFERMGELWEQEGREQELPYLGRLNTRLPEHIYPDTLNLKARVHTRPVGLRPFVELEPTEHPLAVEQRGGVTWDRVRAIAAAVLHGSS